LAAALAISSYIVAFMFKAVSPVAKEYNFTEKFCEEIGFKESAFPYETEKDGGTYKSDDSTDRMRPPVLRKYFLALQSAILSKNY
tara:strand:+ start:437 stop:691 length:255 start_codon:yes stop_codon:yes gene_type:complete